MSLVRTRSSQRCRHSPSFTLGETAWRSPQTALPSSWGHLPLLMEQTFLVLLLTLFTGGGSLLFFFLLYVSILPSTTLLSDLKHSSSIGLPAPPVLGWGLWGPQWPSGPLGDADSTSCGAPDCVSICRGNMGPKAERCVCGNANWTWASVVGQGRNMSHYVTTDGWHRYWIIRTGTALLYLL